MKTFLKTHRYVIAIICTVILFIAALIAAAANRHFADSPPSAVPPGRIHDAGVFGEDIVVHDSAGGEIVITATPRSADADTSASESHGSAASSTPSAPAANVVADPETIWTEDTYAGNHTHAEKAQMKNGSIGVLTIPAINLSVNVYESPDNMEAMSRGIAHFPSTSAFDGNVGLSGHNINYDGSAGYFIDLHTLREGDAITYQTALGVRGYTVGSVSEIEASDWSPLGYTDDHRLTLITCISGQPDKRLCITALAAG